MEQILANPTMLIVAVACIIFAVIIALSFNTTPYEPAKALMTDAELNFYRQLMRIVPPGILVFSKVRIADIINVKASVKGKGRIKHFNPIAAKHFDFVLVDDKKMHILGAIELNDSSHERKDRKERDIFVRKVMASAGLPLFEIKATRKYKLEALHRDLLALTPSAPADLPGTIAHIPDANPALNVIQQSSHDTNPAALQNTAPSFNSGSGDIQPALHSEQTTDFKPKPLSSFMEATDDQSSPKTT